MYKVEGQQETGFKTEKIDGFALEKMGGGWSASNAANFCLIRVRCRIFCSGTCSTKQTSRPDRKHIIHVTDKTVTSLLRISLH